MPRRTRILAALAAIIAIALGIDATAIEPYRLEVTHHVVQGPVAKAITIAHLSDLHTCGLGRHERKVIAALEIERPDLIVISGDSVTDACRPEAQKELLAAISGIAPRLGVWLVFGNWEHWHPVKHLTHFYADAGIHLLDNQNAQLEGPLWIAGFDDLRHGNPDLAKGIAGIPADAFTIGVFHEPAFFDSAASHLSLAFAGHTHGGQVRIPFLPPLWLPSGSGNYLHGWYERDGAKMYVTRGIGTSTLPIRFNCIPELAIVRLEPRQ